MKDQVHDLKDPVDKRGDGSDTAKPRDASKRHVTTYGRLLIGQPSLTYKTTNTKKICSIPGTNLSGLFTTKEKRRHYNGHLEAEQAKQDSPFTRCSWHAQFLPSPWK